MDLEQDLKQASFRSINEKTVLNILLTAYRLNDINTEILCPFGITIQQYNILRILRGKHPAAVSVNLIHDRMMDKNSGVSRLVEKLRRKGLVSRTVNDKDRRQVDVIISAKGLELLGKIDVVITRIHAAASALNARDLRLLNDLLDKIRTRAASILT
jgi:DNA-binding MarR family transcriptional regulator